MSHPALPVEQRRRLSYWVGYGLAAVFVFPFIHSITLRWIALVVLSGMFLPDAATYAVFVVAVLGSVVAGVQRRRRKGWPRWASFLPIWDYAYLHEIRPGAKLVRDLGLAGDEDRVEVGWYVRGEPTVLTFKAPSLRVDVDTVEAAATRGAAFMGARETVVDEMAPGVMRIKWYRSQRNDPLANLAPLDTPTPMVDWDRIPCGYTRTEDWLGLEPMMISVRERSGIVVGGVPGSGKSAGLFSLTGSLMTNESVQLCIFDGKAGADWEWLAPRAALYNNDDEDLGQIADQLEQLNELRRYRTREMSNLRGGSSFWNTGGPSPDMPLMVIVLDECQTFFDPTGIIKDVEGKKKIEDIGRCVRAVTDLVKKGRSVGFVVIPTTQKPTSDSLPTAIGSNASTNIAFRLKTPEAERAVLGSAPADGEPSATKLPDRPGYAVMEVESGAREVVRFTYCPEAQLAVQAEQCAYLRRDFGALMADADGHTTYAELAADDLELWEDQ